MVLLHRKPTRRPAGILYTVKRLRPLRRRALSTARPPADFMRRLKPWVLARFLTFGCQVRLGMDVSPRQRDKDFVIILVSQGVSNRFQVGPGATSGETLRNRQVRRTSEVRRTSAGAGLNPRAQRAKPCRLQPRLSSEPRSGEESRGRRSFAALRMTDLTCTVGLPTRPTASPPCQPPGRGTAALPCAGAGL